MLTLLNELSAARLPAQQASRIDSKDSDVLHGKFAKAFWKTGENCRVSAATRAEYIQIRGKQGE
jgi:hypothetical protein